MKRLIRAGRQESRRWDIAIGSWGLAAKQDLAKLAAAASAAGCRRVGPREARPNRGCVAPMEIVRRDRMPVLTMPGIASHQLLFPENSASARVTITKVVVDPGAMNARHRHASSEQVWFALRGSGVLLLANDATEPFAEGDVVRFAEGDVHGFQNTGTVPFEYIAVTAPPINFRGVYAEASVRAE
jgi:mannose-6-phosphate isomerase-like protein (cupin superfamily)